MRRNGVDVFSVRDLRLRSSDLIKGAEAGRLSVLTKRGKPEALTVPFDERLVHLGLDKDLALCLFERGLITMAKAAKMAGLPLDRFMDMLAASGITAVDYPPDELRAEMKIKI
ncbi:MAG: UPF0175 family protein [Acidobacteriota bacterium]